MNESRRSNKKMRQGNRRNSRTSARDKRAEERNVQSTEQNTGQAIQGRTLAKQSQRFNGLCYRDLNHFAQSDLRKLFECEIIYIGQYGTGFTKRFRNQITKGRWKLLNAELEKNLSENQRRAVELIIAEGSIFANYETLNNEIWKMYD